MAKAKGKKSKAKSSTKRELVVLARWKSAKKAAPQAFCDGWATLNLNGWSAGLHLDKDSMVTEVEIQDAIESFLNLDAFQDTAESSWEFRIVVPLLRG
jgi:hypothetical protein